MKQLSIIISICASFVWLSALTEQKAQGQEGFIFGTCDADNNTAPNPDCRIVDVPHTGTLHQDSTVSWITGTTHCHSHPMAYRECLDGTTSAATKHTEPVNWSCPLVNGLEGTYVAQRGWVYPIFSSNAFCWFPWAYANDSSYVIYICCDYTLGVDSPTTVSGPACQSYELHDWN